MNRLLHVSIGAGALLLLGIVLVVRGKSEKERPQPPPISESSPTTNTKALETHSAQFTPSVHDKERETRRKTYRAFFEYRLKAIQKRTSLTEDQSGRVWALLCAEVDWWVSNTCPEGSNTCDGKFDHEFPRSRVPVERTTAVENEMRKILSDDQWRAYEELCREKPRLWFILKSNGTLARVE